MEKAANKVELRITQIAVAIRFAASLKSVRVCFEWVGPHVGA